MTFMKIIAVELEDQDMCGGICKELLTAVNIAHICVRVVTSISQQVDMPSHLHNSEQASCADEQVHICEEHGSSCSRST